MDRKSARQILMRLADGIDPCTGETFPRESPYQRPEVVRALYVAVNDLGAQLQGRRSEQLFDVDIEESVAVSSRVLVRAANMRQAREKVAMGEWESIEETGRDVRSRDIVAESCRECGESLEGGEGWDGLCGSCADAAENEEQS